MNTMCADDPSDFSLVTKIFKVRWSSKMHVINETTNTELGTSPKYSYLTFKGLLVEYPRLLGRRILGKHLIP